ncbi:tRNA pseudouridine(65) synthase TruC [Pasteurellaceae bacterium USgator11]|nr:tRNA pseudouridine(65) synthase TruC [Pasteurellaceae bacterium UScroc12]TNG97537.1 tRNA pseudouridine(65) synthase TruC [Pasteurellaceae bacterium USgator41]TNG99345.1 tRNA pseudouridine(65) synthase TruC [Pasteurellaceae bacterium USgator11]TNG99589.1 tRNA pseudouridine(65) synthase TruC [Pasteurellaceae bacterium UScroc31]
MSQHKPHFDSDSGEQTTAPSPILQILYCDEDIIAVNKPAGMLVHRSWLDKHETRFLMQTLRDQIGQHVYTVHRLDRPTSGVLVLALNQESARCLSRQFEQKQIEKSYLAVVRGFLCGQGRIDYPLKEQLDKIADKFSQPEKAAQSAVTDYQILAQIEMPYPAGRYASARYSLVKLLPQTGRKHQLRRHMKHLHHPIIGDSAYGDLRQNRTFSEHLGCSGLMLHAHKICFEHPISGQKITICAEVDQNWQRMLNIFKWKINDHDIY